MTCGESYPNPPGHFKISRVQALALIQESPVSAIALTKCFPIDTNKSASCVNHCAVMLRNDSQFQNSIHAGGLVKREEVSFFVFRSSLFPHSSTRIAAALIPGTVNSACPPVCTVMGVAQGAGWEAPGWSRSQ